MRRASWWLRAFEWAADFTWGLRDPSMHRCPSCRLTWETRESMRSMGGVIQAALRASFLISAPVSERERDITIEAHVRIVDAIKNRNPEAASAEMANVIVNGIKRLQDSVATPQGKRRTVGGLNGVRKRVQQMDQT